MEKRFDRIEVKMDEALKLLYEIRADVEGHHREIYGNANENLTGMKKVQGVHATQIRNLHVFVLVMVILITLGYFGQPAEAAVTKLIGVFGG